MNKEYLGDGVYVDYLEYGFVITTENGVEATNTIVLEPDVAKRLLNYIERQRNQWEMFS